LESAISGNDSYALIGVMTQLPLSKQLSMDLSFDNGTHLAGGKKGYLGTALGFAYHKADEFRTSARYELRRQAQLQHILSLGGVGRLTSSVSVLTRFRRADLGGNGRSSDGQVAFSVRPRKSDRLAFLFGYDQGRSNGGASLGLTSGRRDELTADAYFLVAPKTESYTRFAAVQLPAAPGVSRDIATFIQTRLQRSLAKRFDVAAEGRWVRETSRGSYEPIVAGELGFWLTKDFRFGGGYSTRGFVNPGSLLSSTATRGGAYFVISSRLSAMFDLMGGGN
jgi:hypothetical protein